MDYSKIVKKTERCTVNNCVEVILEFLDDIKVEKDVDWEILWKEFIKSENEYVRIIFLMECLLKNLSKDKIIYCYNMIIDSTLLDWSGKLYLYNQLSGIMFRNVEYNSFEISKLSYELYKQISDAYIERIGFCERDFIINRSDLIFLTIQQVLGMGHGPTKTLLDRARVLINKLGKKLIIINTAEMGGGSIPFKLVESYVANYNNSLTDQEFLEYEGLRIPFAQLNNGMPNIDEGMLFYEFVKKYKPAYIVNIGSNSVCMDAASKLVPVININTVPSSISANRMTYQVCGVDLTDDMRELLSILGKDEKSVIKGRFTSSLKPQSNIYSRSDLGLPEDKMILIAVGGRLTEEITDEFIEMISPVLAKGAVLAIAGNMLNYDEKCEKYEIFRKNSVYLGMQDDMLAVLECCDIYVNPKRRGGGTSVIEAMYKGCPAVSINMGDVALGAGQQFCVDDYSAMQNKLIRYMEDKDYYLLMSEKAIGRAKYMLDSDTAFVEIINEFEKKININ